MLRDVVSDGLENRIAFVVEDLPPWSSQNTSRKSSDVYLAGCHGLVGSDFEGAGSNEVFAGPQAHIIVMSRNTIAIVVCKRFMASLRAIASVNESGGKKPIDFEALSGKGGSPHDPSFAPNDWQVGALQRTRAPLVFQFGSWSCEGVSLAQ